MNVATLQSEIGLVARRIRRFAESIAQGHEFGIRPGPAGDLTTDAFQDLAVEVYRESLPWSYLVGLSRVFAERAVMIDENLPDCADAAVLAAYLRSVSGAIVRAAPTEELLAPAPDVIADRTPPVMPFHRLAELVTVDAARRLRDTARSVEDHLADQDSCPLTNEELTWLRRMRAGDRVIDIARDHGLAERTLYRGLRQVWATLGVSNRIDGISTAVANGWLDD